MKKWIKRIVLILIILLVLMLALAVHSCLLPGAAEGLKYYLFFAGAYPEL